MACHETSRIGLFKTNFEPLAVVDIQTYLTLGIYYLGDCEEHRGLLTRGWKSPLTLLQLMALRLHACGRYGHRLYLHYARSLRMWPCSGLGHSVGFTLNGSAHTRFAQGQCLLKGVRAFLFLVGG